jgi:hypothetical protein
LKQQMLIIHLIMKMMKGILIEVSERGNLLIDTRSGLHFLSPLNNLVLLLVIVT